MNTPEHNPATQRTLCPQDAAAVDALLEYGGGAAGPVVTPGSREDGVAARVGPTSPTNDISSGIADDARRLERVRSIFALMGACPAPEAPADLTARTLQTISDLKRRERVIEAASVAPMGRSFRLGEIAAMFAILLIGASLLWPSMDRSRQEARQLACESNLGLAGRAMFSYAADYDDTLPRRGSWPGAIWWNVGKHADVPDTLGQPIESNSAHLYTLVRKTYAPAEMLSCPDNAAAPRGGTMSSSLNDWTCNKAVSFSYQNQFTPKPTRASRAPTIALLADRNPHFAPRCGVNGPGFDTGIPADAPSYQHRGRGQNILLAGGQTVWTQTPVFPNGDNIYLLNNVSTYLGNETTADEQDTFLSP